MGLKDQEELDFKVKLKEIVASAEAGQAAAQAPAENPEQPAA